MSALYRVRQFAQAVGALVRPPDRYSDLPEAGDDDLAARYLAPEALVLFRTMPRYDRRHGLAVARHLHAAGHDDPDLIVAALLHDVGKSCHPGGRVSLMHRVATVLARAVEPGLLERLGCEGARWRRPFYVQVHHAALGAELAHEVGCSATTVWLIRHHEDVAEEEDSRLAVLQAADSHN
jgi:putative nucleotidyltransferase with HDIG domain